jgi:flagellar hook-associated protein 2
MSSNISLSGISGYDFSGIIQSMVDVYKLPENRMNQKKSDLSAEKSAWQEINTRLAAIDTALNTLKDSKTWLSTSASTPTTNSYFSITNTGAGVSGTYVVKISQIAKSETVVSKELSDSNIETEMNTALGTNYSDNGTSSNWDFTLSVNGQPAKNVHVVKSDSTKSAPTLQDIANSINKANAGVTASLIQSSGGTRIAFYSTQTGSANSITFGDPNSFLKTAGVLNAGGTVNDYTVTGLSDPLVGGKVQNAQDAIFTVNGLSVTNSTNTISNAIQGVSLTLNAPGESNVTVTSDPTIAKNAVKAFIDAYNSAQDKISSYVSYDKTTKKAGILFGDQSVQSIQSSLRQKVASVITGPGNYKVLSDIGIATSSANYGKSPDLVFDETKFMSALTKDAKSVANLFSASYMGSTPVEDPNNTDVNGNSAPIHDGLSNMLKAYLNPFTKYGGIIDSTTGNFDQQIRDINIQIENLEERALAYEESLKKKYASLEATLSGLKSQGDWLASQTLALSSQDK